MNKIEKRDAIGIINMKPLEISNEMNI